MKLLQEIFAAGTWNGFPFTVNDLRKMAASFEALGDVLKVPLKLGHNDEQEMTDGQPALGWVTALHVDAEATPPKLIAEFDDVPSIVHEAFEKKLYRAVSIELDFDVRHKDIMYDFVITAVALLGADMPAVNVLNDLASFMSRNSQLAKSGYAAGSRGTYSSIIKGNIGVSNMDPKEEAELRSELATAQVALAAQKANFTKLETDTEAAAKAATEAAAQIATTALAEKVEIARAKFTVLLESAVTDKSITPAQREAFTKALRLDDDDAVLALSEDDVKALFVTDDDASKFGKGKGKHKDDSNTDTRADHSLTQMAYKHMAESGSKDFSAAVTIVMQAHPDLAAEYIDSNGEVKH